MSKEFPIASVQNSIPRLIELSSSRLGLSNECPRLDGYGPTKKRMKAGSARKGEIGMLVSRIVVINIMIA